MKLVDYHGMRLLKAAANLFCKNKSKASLASLIDSSRLGSPSLKIKLIIIIRYKIINGAF